MDLQIGFPQSSQSTSEVGSDHELQFSDTPLLTNKNEKSIQSHLNKHCQVIKIKDLLHFRNEPVVCFVDINGNPCDEEAKLLFEANKLETGLNLEINSINIYNRIKKQYITLCIKGRTSESLTHVKENIRTTLHKL